jgi:uncharacterized phage-associated protein
MEPCSVESESGIRQPKNPDFFHTLSFSNIYSNASDILNGLMDTNYRVAAVLCESTTHAKLQWYEVINYGSAA